MSAHTATAHTCPGIAGSFARSQTKIPGLPPPQTETLEVTSAKLETPSHVCLVGELASKAAVEEGAVRGGKGDDDREMEE